MAAFPSGTRKIFKNSTAPTGWTQDATAYNHTLRVITTSTFGSGGTLNFSDCFAASRSAGGITQPGAPSTVTLGASSMDIPAHSHTFYGSTGTPVNSPNSGFPYTAGPTTPPTITGWFGAPSFRTSGSAGVNTGHTHTLSGSLSVSLASDATINLNVKYVDSIICIKS